MSDWRGALRGANSVGLAIVGLLLAGSAPAVAAPHETLILRNAAVYTLDPAQPWATAVVIRGGTIAFVGKDAGAMAFARSGAPSSARSIDLHGQMVLPGFHDGHAHPMTSGLWLLRCRLNGLTSEPQIDGAIRACAAAKPAKGWLLGRGWSPSAFGPAGPRLETLDALVPDRPAWFADESGFKVWVNSRALAESGIDARAPQLKGLERDPVNGRPTGVLTDEAATAVRRHLPPPSESEYRAALQRSSAMANAAGVTSIFDASVTAPVVSAYHAADRAGELRVRVTAAQLIDPQLGPQQVDALIAQRDAAPGRLFRADAAKIFLDGEIDMHDAALLQPYADTPGDRGVAFVTADRLEAIVRRLDAEGFLIHMHAMGDAAVRLGLDAIAAAGEANGRRDRRHQIAHLGVVDPADIPRFGRLGVAANFQPLWFPADDPAAAPTEAALGPARSRWIMPAASIAAGGGRIVAGSDWPALPMSPLAGIQAAMTRQPLGRVAPPRQPEERLGLAAILAAYTRDAAWAVRDDGVDGVVAVGKAADLVVLNRNLFRTRVSQIHRARVQLTLLAGAPVYCGREFSKRLKSCQAKGR